MRFIQAMFMKVTLLLAVLVIPSAQGAILQENDYYAQTLTSAKVLQQWYKTNGLWNSAEWWNAANALEAMECVIQANNGQQYLDVIATTFDHNHRKNFLNEYYDDEGWWAESWIRAFDLTGDARYLAMAKTIFADMKGGWNDHCGGGIWWKKDSQYVNAIANELFLLVAIRLHQRTPGDHGEGSYFDWAQREWTWFDHSGMINFSHLVNDGLDESCKNNHRTTWTYNQGVLIGALVDLYKSTSDARLLAQAGAIANASLRSLVDSEGVLAELDEWRGLGGKDVPQFKGIFVRHLAELYDVTHEAKYREFLVRNARSVWANDRNNSNQFGGHWAGPVDAVDAIRHTSAMRVIATLAEPVTTNLPFVAPAGSPGFRHETGAAAGACAWKCGEGDQRGCLLIGPSLESVSVGPHVAHFRLAADALSLSETILARLEVTQNDGESVLALRDIHAADFPEANQPRDFSLNFTNVHEASNFQFRIEWNAAPKSPALTAMDVSLDGNLNFSSANMLHEIGRPDQFDQWRADPIRDRKSGCLAQSLGATGLPAGAYEVCFELKVDNFNRDNAAVATVSVRDAASAEIMAERVLRRGDFPNVLYQTFTLPINLAAGQKLDIRTAWNAGGSAPSLTQRSLIIRPQRHNP